MSSDDESVQLNVEKTAARRRNINLKNIEPMGGIQIIRPEESDSESMSSASSMKPRKTKKVLRKKCLIN